MIKSFFTALLFIVLLLLPMSWPIIIVIMTIHLIGSFSGKKQKNKCKEKDYYEEYIKFYNKKGENSL